MKIHPNFSSRNAIGAGDELPRLGLRKALGPLALALILGLMLACGGAPATEGSGDGEDSSPSPEASLEAQLEDCQLTSPGSPATLDARCGTLEVPENRAVENGRILDLYFAVLPAVSRTAEEDAVVFLAGGPGQASTETYLQVSPAIGPLNHDRPILLMDQRGTGSSHALECPGLAMEESLEMPDDDELKALVQECVEELSQDADPRQYTTEAAARDLEALREALGYPQLNLYGVSYGTRLALAYADLFPQRVRTLVLDGVVPHDVALGETLARDAQNALELIFQRCADDEACGEAFPDLQQKLDGLMASLAEDPRPVRLDHPRTGASVELTFNEETLAGGLRLLTYAPETAALVPLLITDAVENDDLRRLAALALTVGDGVGSQISAGLSYSVTCAEDVPFVDVEASAEASRGTYLGESFFDSLQEICSVWPYAELPATVRSAVRSDVPSLLLSGEADPVTPPAFAERTAQTLSNSLTVVAPGLGHNVILRGCLPQQVQAFIEAGSLEAVDAECVEAIEAAPFFLNFSGPRP
ncbi:MAG: alpha/beta hydrolase [Acidobacteriota bacterium]|nr:alpha/beta hydrolase [Acidobacteriota bacterium]